jgi:hypothetical protein
MTWKQDIVTATAERDLLEADWRDKKGGKLWEPEGIVR